MSTKPTAAEPPADARGVRRRSRAYRRTVVATIGILSIAVAALGIAGAFRAPRLDDASAAAEAALSSAGQRVVLRLDQAIAAVDPADVRVEPEVPITVESDARTITVRFDGMLRARTEYTVDATVTGASTGVTATLSYAFSTPDLDATVLVRDAESADEIVRRPLSGGEPEVLFSADRIQEFAILDYGVAAVVLDDEGAAGRVVIAPDGETMTQEVPLPATGRVTQLRVSDTSGLLGFVFTPTESSDPETISSELLVFDPADPSGTLSPVTGLDGSPLSVLDWRFVPGTPYLVVQAFDQSMLLIDTATDASPVPLGEHVEVRGFVPGTLELVVADPLSGSTIDLATGKTTELKLPPDGASPTDYPGKIVLLRDDAYAEIIARPTSATDFRLDYRVVVATEEAAEVVFDPEAGAAIRDICLSPNAQYLAIEVQDPDGRPDGYPALSSRDGTITHFVDLETGDATTMAGFAVSWCR